MGQVAGQAWATTQEVGLGRTAAYRRMRDPGSGREESTIRHHRPNRRGRLLTVLVAMLAVAAALAPSAVAHSVLIATEPGNDVVVPESPDQVVLEFNEAVDASLGSVRVIDGQGNQVESGEVTQPVATEVAVGIDSELAPGTYTVAWRVVSADSDPISGAFVFHVIERGVAANVSIDALTGTSQAVDVLFIIDRFVDFALLLLVVGGSAVLVVALPSAQWRVRRRLYGILAAAAGGLAAIALVNILLQGATAGGLSLSDALSWSLFTSVLETDYGEVMLIQSALAATLALTALALRHAADHDRRPLTALTLALAAGLSLTPSFSGHARTLGGARAHLRHPPRHLGRALDRRPRLPGPGPPRGRLRPLAAGDAGRSALLEPGRRVGRRAADGRCRRPPTSSSAPGARSGTTSTGCSCWRRSCSSSRSSPSAPTTTATRCRA